MDPALTAADLYVSLDGNDDWTGRLPEPNTDGTDGPVKSIDTARRKVREMKSRGALPAGMTVHIRGGRYHLTRPLVFTPEDAGPVSYAPYKDEAVTLDGGVRISDWAVTEHNGRPAWLADVSGHLATYGPFKSLFVNGERRDRPRLPKKGFLWMEDVPDIDRKGWRLFDGSRRFVAAEGDIENWDRVGDVDVVVMHFWIDDRMPIESYDPETRVVTSSRRSIFALADDWSGTWAKYYLDNVGAALSEPGEWYLDKTAQTLTYLPKDGETPEGCEVVVPVLLQILRLEGDPVGGRCVHSLRFRGLTMQYTDWVQPSGRAVWFDPYKPADTWRWKDSFRHFVENNGCDPNGDYATVPQGAIHIPGAVWMEGAHQCELADCTIQHIGSFGVDLGEGCQGVRIVGNAIGDMAAGGVKVDGGDHTSPPSRRTHGVTVSDNTIHAGGRIWGAAPGVILVHAAWCTVAHNEIHDMFYTGVSCGWVWGYTPSVSMQNCIEFNHIHDIGQGILNDMAAIYLLGVQPGTTIRNNFLHDVRRSNYGGSGVYMDEGTSHVVVEDNVVCNVDDWGCCQHFGVENIIRNNIFVDCAGGLENGRPPRRMHTHGRVSYNAMSNIIVVDNSMAVLFNEKKDELAAGRKQLRLSNNLYWNKGEGGVYFKRRPPFEIDDADTLRLVDAQQQGYDVNSIEADPKLGDVVAGDVSLPEDSPAWTIGFCPIDMSTVGPRPTHQR
ncbi:MAG: hypothetical protein GVY16_06430 [Planctomycetes bacterium]|jgi:hypothetical protein|nr:hypothetical protein [Planctomycetota bacterium]